MRTDAMLALVRNEDDTTSIVVALGLPKKDNTLNVASLGSVNQHKDSAVEFIELNQRTINSDSVIKYFPGNLILADDNSLDIK